MPISKQQYSYYFSEISMEKNNIIIHSLLHPPLSHPRHCRNCSRFPTPHLTKCSINLISFFAQLSSSPIISSCRLVRSETLGSLLFEVCLRLNWEKGVFCWWRSCTNHPGKKWWSFCVRTGFWAMISLHDSACWRVWPFEFRNLSWRRFDWRIHLLFFLS